MNVPSVGVFLESLRTESLFGGCYARASDKCQREKRKTINGDDLLWAMATLGFEEYIDPLKVYLARYREVIMFSWFLGFSLDCLLLEMNCLVML